MKMERENKPVGNWFRGLRLWGLRVLLCIFAVLIVCSCCALLEVNRSKRQLRENVYGSTVEGDKIRIYIDQGHNPLPYHNNGAEGNGLYEQDVTFAIGCRLAALLEADGRFEVCLSRPMEDTVLGTDTMSSLAARVEGAKLFEADYFISLHINSYTDASVNGIEVFVAEENLESAAFGNAMLQGMVDSTNLKDRGIRQSSELYVLENTDMPAALLEMGYISNAEDAAFLSQSSDLFAQGIYDGLLDYFESAYNREINVLLGTLGISAVLVILLSVVLRKQTKRKQ